MSILAANLKHLYQRRALWLFYFFCLSYIPLCLVKGQRISLLFLVFGVGTVLGSCQREVMSRPFAFLLPRHTWLVPRLALMQGTFLGGITALCWLAMPGRAWTHLPTGFLLGTSCYLLGTLLGFALPYLAPTFLCFLPMIFILNMVAGDAAAIDHVFQAHAVRAGAFALLTIAWAWFRLSRRDLARWCQTTHSLFLSDAFDMAKANQYHRRRYARRASARSESAGTALAQACIRGIRRSQPESLRRYLYAVCARVFGNLTLGHLAPTSMLLLTAVLVSMYGGKGAAGYFAVFPAMFIRGAMYPQVNPFLPLGRRQRRMQAGLHLLVLTMLTIVLALLTILAARIAAPWMPSIAFDRISMQPQSLPLFYSIFPACGLPLAYAIHVWCKKKFVLAAMLWLVPLLFAVMVLAQIPAQPSPLVWFSIPPVSLLLALGLLHHHFRRRDLV